MVARERQRDGIAAVAQRDQRRLLALEPLLDDDADADARALRIVAGKGVERLVRLQASQTVTPFPAARPSALTTTPSPPARELVRERARRRHAVSNARPSAIRTPAAAAISWQNALLDSMRAAAAVGPNDGDPAASSASATPAASGASGPMTASSTASRRASSTTDAPSSGSTPGRPGPAAPRAMRGAARRDDHLVDARFGGQLPGERVLAPAAADDRGPGWA